MEGWAPSFVVNCTLVHNKVRLSPLLFSPLALLLSWRPLVGCLFCFFLVWTCEVLITFAPCFRGLFSKAIRCNIFASTVLLSSEQKRGCCSTRVESNSKACAAKCSTEERCEQQRICLGRLAHESKAPYASCTVKPHRGKGFRWANHGLSSARLSIGPYRLIVYFAP